MTRRLIVLGTLVAVAPLIAVALGRYLRSHTSEVRSVGRRAPEFPRLFERYGQCPHDALSLRAASRAEFQAMFLSDRYPYDPRDGVRAVERFREAQSCYEASGADEEARRTASLASALAARIELDYASSRLALETAIATEKWSVAHHELQKLLRLTEHRRGHPFTEHLRSVAGKVAIRAGNSR